MKTVTAALVLFSTLGPASSALAADLVYSEPAPASAPTAYDWSGFYLGAHGGYVWTDVEEELSGETEDFDGGLLGVHAGYNWQSGSIVYGLEADLSHTWNEETIVGIDFGTDWQGSVRARLGYAMDRTLFYGTAGVAATNVYAELGPVSIEDTAAGYTIGGGVEHAFTRNWTARAEYRYTDFGDIDFGLGAEAELTEHSLRAGVSYRF